MNNKARRAPESSNNMARRIKFKKNHPICPRRRDKLKEMSWPYLSIWPDDC